MITNGPNPNLGSGEDTTPPVPPIICMTHSHLEAATERLCNSVENLYSSTHWSNSKSTAAWRCCAPCAVSFFPLCDCRPQEHLTVTADLSILEAPPAPMVCGEVFQDRRQPSCRSYRTHTGSSAPVILPHTQRPGDPSPINHDVCYCFSCAKY